MHRALFRTTRKMELFRNIFTGYITPLDQYIINVFFQRTPNVVHVDSWVLLLVHIQINKQVTRFAPFEQLVSETFPFSQIFEPVIFSCVGNIVSSTFGLILKYFMMRFACIKCILLRRIYNHFSYRKNMHLRTMAEKRRLWV